jgi:glycosyl transferase family 2
MLLSVIICTHNPRQDYFSRVLDALRQQTLEQSEWELVVIDNVSSRPLRSHVDLSWHPSARLVVEPELGLMQARLRGIKETAGEVLVFVDDDNVLAANYLEKALVLAREWPMLGVWGAGQLRPDFDVPPLEWTRPYWPLIAVGGSQRDVWSNTADVPSVPCGAGMCIRRAVAEQYVEHVKKNPVRNLLGRRGKSLGSGEDTDLALSACELGLGTAVFAGLIVTHMVPPDRLTREYFVRMHEERACSDVLLATARSSTPPAKTFARWCVDYLRACCLPSLQRQFRFAALRGERRGRQIWKAAAARA